MSIIHHTHADCTFANLGADAEEICTFCVGALVSVMAILAALARAPAQSEGQAMKLATYAIGTVGSFWLIERLIG